MTNFVRMTVAATAGLAVVIGGATLAAAPARATAKAESTELRPATLQRGPDVRIPHVEGRTVVDGDVRVKVLGGDRVTLLGRSGKAYVVVVTRDDRDGGVVKRVRPGAAPQVILRGASPYDLRLSGDGLHLLRTTFIIGGSGRTRVTAYGAGQGKVLSARTLKGSVSVLDAFGGRAVLGSWSPARTLWWNYVDNTTSPIVGRTGYRADISTNRLASYSGDPYDGGCSVVGALDASKPAWRSCSERVEAFSPGLSRMATVHLLSDGLGPNRVKVRKADGVLIGDFTAKFFGELVFESERALLLETYGAQRAATVRCQAATCVRASDLRPVPDFRAVS